MQYLLLHSPQADAITSTTVLSIERLDLVPPSLSTGTEVILSPGREDDLSRFIDIAVGKSKRERSRPTDDRTIGSVLGSMTGAHELVVGSGPRDDTSKMSAHCRAR